MARVTVPGVGTFTVDDAIKSLSPEQQASEVASMVSQYQAHQAAQPPAQASEPSPGEVTENGITPGLGSNGLSDAGSAIYGALPGALQRGLNYVGSGAASTLQNILGDKSDADAIRSHLDQNALSQPSTMADLGQSLKSGKVLRALSDIPGAVLEGAPSAFPAIATTALTGGTDILAGLAAAGAGALGAVATQSGDLAAARAAHNGSSTPSLADKAIGVASAAGLGGVAGLGLGAGGSLPVRILANAAADGGQSVGQQLATTAGTTDGVQVEPGMVAGAAVAGAAGRGVLSAVHEASDAVQGMTPAARQQALIDRYNAMAPDEQTTAQNTVAANNTLQAGMSDAVGNSSPARVSGMARTQGKDLDGLIETYTNRLQALGAIDDDGASLIQKAATNAAGQQRELRDSDLKAIQGLGLPQSDTDMLTNALQQREILSDAGVVNRGTGPFGAAGRFVGVLPSVLAGGGHTISGLALIKAGGRVGGAIGDRLDSALGMNNPKLVGDAQDYGKMLDAAGVSQPANVKQQLQDAASQQGDVLGQQRALIAQQQASQAAAAQKFKLDYGDAQAINRQVTQSQNFHRSQEVGDARAIAQQMNAQRGVQVQDAVALDQQMTQAQNAQRGLQVQDAQAMDQQMNAQRGLQVQDAFAMDQQMNAQRGLQVQDATAMDRQNTAAQNFQRAQQVGDARAMNATQDRGTNLLESQGGKVAMMALRRAQAQEALNAPSDPATPTQMPASAPKAPGATPVAPQPPTLSQQAPSQPQPGVHPQSPGAYSPDLSGLPPEAHAQAARLPDWMYGLGANLEGALHGTGQARPVNMAAEVKDALASLQGRGMLPADIAHSLATHQGRVVPAVFNLIRNEMLMKNGINRMAP